jgi:hypothetical protein
VTDRDKHSSVLRCDIYYERESFTMKSLDCKKFYRCKFCHNNHALAQWVEQYTRDGEFKGFNPTTGTGPNITKHFTSAIYEFSKKARVFVSGKRSSPSLLFLSKAKSPP